MRVIASTGKCIASGTCVMTCPQVFGQRESDGVVQVIDGHPPLELISLVQQAAEICPAMVFEIEEANDLSELTVVEIEEE